MMAIMIVENEVDNDECFIPAIQEHGESEATFVGTTVGNLSGREPPIEERRQRRCGGFRPWARFAELPQGSRLELPLGQTYNTRRRSM